MKSIFLFFTSLGITELMVLLILIGLAILMFLAIRSLMLWYWKVDRIEELLYEQNVLLRAIHEQPEKPKGKKGKLIHDL